METVDLRRYLPSDTGNHQREINIKDAGNQHDKATNMSISRLQNFDIERQQILSTYRIIEKEMM